ncbi:MAG: Eco57I restriction-modification methylase domain-containing protein [Candidatus Marinimicrobia bacterium]|nr:Eco57I restriction-modification methylase domain-containing protein [Candidatus Neomarinimicrobiota bacterium]
MALIKLYSNEEDKKLSTSSTKIRLYKDTQPTESKNIIKDKEAVREEKPKFELKQAPPEEKFQDTFLKKLGRIVVPKSLEVRLGLRETTISEDMMTQEDAKLSYFRQKEFQDRYNKEIKEKPEIPKEYKEPESVIGQIAEGIKYGYQATVIPSIGYMAEATGRQVGSKKMIDWGSKFGDKKTIELLKKPELFRPKEIETFFGGGYKDPRFYGRTIGETIPFIVTTIGLGVAGGIVGGPAGTSIGSYSAIYAIEKGNAYKNMIDNGTAPDKASLASDIYGVIAAGIENSFGLSPAKIATDITKQNVKIIAVNSFKEYLKKELPNLSKKTLKMALTEGSEEVAQGFTEKLITKWMDENTEVFTKDMAEEFVAGFVGSIPFGVTNVRLPKIVNVEEEKQTQEKPTEKIEVLEKKPVEEKKEKIKLPEYQQEKPIQEEVFYEPTIKSIQDLPTPEQTLTKTPQEFGERWSEASLLIEKIKREYKKNEREEIGEKLENIVEQLKELKGQKGTEITTKRKELTEERKNLKEQYTKIENEIFEKKRTIENEQISFQEKLGKLFIEKTKKLGLTLTKEEEETLVEEFFMGQLEPRSMSYEDYNETTIEEHMSRIINDYADQEGVEIDEFKGSGEFNKVVKVDKKEKVDDTKDNEREISTTRGESGKRGKRMARGEHSKRVSSIGKRPTTQISNAEIEDLVKSKDTFTEHEKNLLRQYTGAGGLEHQGANGRGLLDEYYTPKAVVNLTWELVNKHTDLKKPGINILEPSIGIGSFVDPKQLGFITGYEINPVSAKIAQTLMPGSKIFNEPFESIFIDDRGNKKKFRSDYDLVIGNPPYGEHRGKYKGLGEEKNISKYETYFIKRALDLTKDNGIVAFVLPSSIVRSNKTLSGKKEIAPLGKLIEARRLPNGTFAHTDIGTDILIFKKDKTSDSNIIKDRIDLISNDVYFEKNKDNILGEEKERKGKFGMETYVDGKLPEAQDFTPIPEEQLPDVVVDDPIGDKFIEVDGEEKMQKTVEQSKLEALLAEVSFLERITTRVDSIKKEIKSYEEYLGYSKDTYYYKQAEKNIPKLKKQLEIAEQKLKGVDVNETKKQIEIKQKEVEKQEKIIENLTSKYEEKRKEADGKRVEIIIKENDYNELTNYITQENKAGFFTKKKDTSVKEIVSDKLKKLQSEMNDLTGGKDPRVYMEELQAFIDKSGGNLAMKEKIEKIKKLLKLMAEEQAGFIKVPFLAKQAEEEVDEIISGEMTAKEEYEALKDMWFGKKDERIFETNVEVRLLQKQLKESLGQKRYSKEVQDIDKAIHLYIDTKNNPDHVEEYWDKLSKEQQSIVTLSQNLPEHIQGIANIIAEEYQNIGIEALDEEVIKNVKDNYAGRIWDFGVKKQSDQSRRLFGTTTRHAKARKLETIIEGWAKGYNLKVEGATNNLGVLKTEIIKTIEDKRFLGLLKDLKIGKKQPFISTKQLDGYKLIEHPNFTNWEWAGVAEDGKTYGRNFFITEEGNLLERKQMYAPEKIAKNLNNILGTSYLNKLPAIHTITKWNAIIKAWILQSSFFHHRAFIMSYYLGTQKKSLAELNIRQAYKAGIKSVEELEPTLKLLVRNGLTLGIKQDWEETLLREKTIIGKILDKNLVSRVVKDKILKLREQQANFLFNEFGTGLKAKSAMIELRNLQKEYPNEDINKLAKLAANLINDDFGGLHLKRMGRNPTYQHIFRLFALAPDWTESNIRTIVKMIEGGDKMEKRFYRRFWAGVIVKGMAATVLANLLLSIGGDDDDDEEFLKKYRMAWDAGNFKWLDVDITRTARLTGYKGEERKYFSIFGHFKDPLKFMIHPIRSAHYKGSVMYSFFQELLTGTDWSGRKFTTWQELFGLVGTEKDQEKYKWQTVKYGTGRPLEIKQIPSFLASQLIGAQPIQVQSMIGWMSGEIGGFEAVTTSIGLHTSTTYTSPKTLREEALENFVEKAKNGNESIKKLEDELIKEVYSGENEVTEATENRLKKEFKIRREFGFENEIVNKLLDTQLNKDKVKILIEENVDDSFIRVARRTGLISDELYSQYRKAKVNKELLR